MKFKLGDKIICKEDCHSFYGNQFTKGKIYTVRECDPYYVYLELDDLGSTTNGWAPQYFELAIKYIHNQEFKSKLEDLIND